MESLVLFQGVKREVPAGMHLCGVPINLPRCFSADTAFLAVSQSPVATHPSAWVVGGMRGGGGGYYCLCMTGWRHWAVCMCCT